MAKAPIDIRSLARAYTHEAINTIAGLMRACPNPKVRLDASVALLDRGYGKPQTDADGREAINITIRKILEGGAVTVVETTRTPMVIEHDARDGEAQK